MGIFCSTRFERINKLDEGLTTLNKLYDYKIDELCDIRTAIAELDLRIDHIKRLLLTNHKDLDGSELFQATDKCRKRFVDMSEKKKAECVEIRLEIIKTNKMISML